MRIIVYGVGAVGGVIAGVLTRAGHDCIGIARGDRLQALRENGLTLKSPERTDTVPLTLVAHPSQIDWRPDDAILLVMKGQHTGAALQALRSAGVTDQPIFCTQNGVNNERAALRIFAQVHGINVMLPSEYVALDEAVGFASPDFGIFDIGRYPHGTDAADERLATALTASGIGGYPTPEIMPFKYGKLLMNLGNIVEAALGHTVEDTEIAEALRAEARDVLRKAGIEWKDVTDDPRRERMQIGTVEGAERLGGSSTQSLSRGAGSIETDYLNGEIALIARLHGFEAPLNATAARLASRLAETGAKPGSLTPVELCAELGL